MKVPITQNYKILPRLDKEETTRCRANNICKHIERKRGRERERDRERRALVINIFYIKMVDHSKKRAQLL